MHTEEKINDIDKLIISYLSGELDDNSFSELKRWSMESEANRIYVRNQLEIWFSSGISSDDTFFNKNKGFDFFRQRITEVEKNKGFRRISWKVVYRVAAVFLILLLPLTAYWQGKESVKHNFADIVVEAPLGARTKLYLPDGTLVWLNAGSKIVYSQGFGVDDRNLSLEGEGYFEVIKNEKLPFIVETRELNVKVLGTKFNFKNYPEDEEVTVNLMEGKVALQNELKKMPALYLAPQEKMVLNKRTGIIKKSKTYVEYSNAWSRNELFFDEELLEDIAKKLMRSYDVKIQVADSLRNKRFYGSFKIIGNTIDEVLRAIASTNRMQYKYEDEKYILF